MAGVWEQKGIYRFLFNGAGKNIFARLASIYILPFRWIQNDNDKK